MYIFRCLQNPTWDLDSMLIYKNQNLCPSYVHNFAHKQSVMSAICAPEEDRVITHLKLIILNLRSC